MVFLLSGCSDFRQATGREKIKFDEFTVLEQKSLEIPQNFELEFSNINPSEQTDSIDEFNNLLKIVARDISAVFVIYKVTIFLISVFVYRFNNIFLFSNYL